MSQQNVQLTERLKQTWEAAFANKPDIAKLAPGHVRDVTTHMLEMQMKGTEGNRVLKTKAALSEFFEKENAKVKRIEEAEAAGQYLNLNEETTTGDVAKWDPILMTMVRRSAVSFVAHDLMGVQPMSGPTGLIFCMKSFYGPSPDARTTNDPNEALGLQEPRQSFSTNLDGTPTTDELGINYNQINTSGVDREGTEIVGDTYVGVDKLETVGKRERSGGYDTDDSGTNANVILKQENLWPEMSFRIDKVSITAGERMIKAEYTDELTQDLQAIHGMNARDILAEMLSTEMAAEQNRETVSILLDQAKLGCQNTAAPGFFNLDVDADGRWKMEKIKGLLMQINLEAHLIATETRRGVGNVIVTSSNVVAALEMADLIDSNVTTGLRNIDAVGTTYAGMLNGRFRVYVDPYSNTDYVLVGYKGRNAFDAGAFFCPYVPLQVMEARDSNSFQPKIAFKTRYGMAVNPFIGDHSGNLGAGTRGQNTYYRKFVVVGIV